ncbi:hypothetical protein [Actinacidiphila yeochonensis]|uniref:hypothetical protein n=1 Tax=Actinacidiphila yeochonensis TaxID=89050 RepID=UPI00056029F1|nr:hypothetical protein [Actinacidiphila yeochonensis]
MRRHRFEPAALVGGLVLLVLAACFLLDAAGALDLSRPSRSLRLVGGGLLLTVLTAGVTQTVRSVRGRPGRRRRP